VYKSLLKRECGIRVVSTTESIEDDKFSVILEAMLEAMAEYYSLNLAEEVKKGMTEKAERGEYQTRPPFGYTMENKKLWILEEESNVIKIIFQKFADREMGLSEIARYANTFGVKTKQGKTFYNRTINYILNNPVYIGKVRWTPTGKFNSNFNHPDTITMDSDHEPIIDMETWDKTQERLREYKEIYRPREKTTTRIASWMKGLVKCSDCGRALSVSAKKYMQCNSYLKGGCLTSNHVAIATLESLPFTSISLSIAWVMVSTPQPFQGLNPYQPRFPQQTCRV
jgi:hypothetical protein